MILDIIVRGERRFPPSNTLVVAFLFAVALPRAARAAGPLGPGFDLQWSRPTPAGDRFELVPEPRIRDESCDVGLACGTSLAADVTWAHAPLRLQQRYPDGRIDVKSSESVRLDLGVGWAPITWLKWSVNFPFNLLQSDMSQYPGAYSAPLAAARLGRSADVGDLGDLRTSVRSAWRRGDVSAGLQVDLAAPTGDRETLTGANGFAYDGVVLVEMHLSLVAITAFDGIEYRPPTEFLDGRTLGGLGGTAGAALLVGACGDPGATTERECHVPQATFEIRGDQLGSRTWHPGSAAVGLRIELSRHIWLSATQTAGLSHAPGVPVLGYAVRLTGKP